MRLSRASRRLAARAHARQIEVSRRADAAADSADRAVLRVWRRLLALLRGKPHWGEAYLCAAGLFAALAPEVRKEIDGSLRRLAVWGWRSAVSATVESLPQRALIAAAANELREAEDDVFSFALQILFPVPSAHDINHVLFGHDIAGRDWQTRLAAATRLAQPRVLADILAGGLAAGKTPRQIAKDLLPAVQNVRASARRIARTEALRVAGDMQMRCHQQLGDLVIGYQVRATLDQHTRWWHRQRDGAIYYLDPQPGQKGPAQMPSPPDEPLDPNERPPGTPQTAWNCRCWLSPVLRS